MQTIEINGKSYPLNFGVAATAEIYDAVGLKFTADGFAQQLELTFKTMTKMAHIALKHGARVNGQQWPWTYEETCDNLFDHDMEAISKIVEMFNEAMVDTGNAKAPAKKKAPAQKKAPVQK